MDIFSEGIVLRRGTVTFAPQHPWPEGTGVQFGVNGIVFGAKSGPYRTAFFEVFPQDPQTFVRGEGDTPAAAEDAAWARWERIVACDGHVMERRGYRNGGGVCANCNLFVSRCFDPISPTDAERAEVVALLGPFEGRSYAELHAARAALDDAGRERAAAVGYAMSEMLARVALGEIDADMVDDTDDLPG
jgi:hypothetical protein